MSVDYRLLPRFEASRKRHEAAWRILPGRWRSDPRPEAQIMNDHWVGMIAAAAARHDHSGGGGQRRRSGSARRRPTLDARVSKAAPASDVAGLARLPPSLAADALATRQRS